MERRKALATAASVSAVALAATIALGTNVGLFGLTTHDNGPGSFQLVDSKKTKPVVRTEIVDVPVTTPGSGGSTSGSTGPSVSNDQTSEPSTVGTTPRAGDDDEADDDSHGSEPEHDQYDEHDERDEDD